MLVERNKLQFPALAQRAGMDERSMSMVLAYWNRRLFEQRPKDWT